MSFHIVRRRNTHTHTLYQLVRFPVRISGRSCSFSLMLSSCSMTACGNHAISPLCMYHIAHSSAWSHMYLCHRVLMVPYYSSLSLCALLPLPSLLPLPHSHLHLLTSNLDLCFFSLSSCSSFSLCFLSSQRQSPTPIHQVSTETRLHCQAAQPNKAIDQIESFCSSILTVTFSCSITSRGKYYHHEQRELASISIN